MSLVEQFPDHDRNPSTAGFDLLPDLPILLRSPPHTLSGLALVDSGATVSVLPYSLGLQLGFDWNSQSLQLRLTGVLAHVEARGRAFDGFGQLSERGQLGGINDQPRSTEQTAPNFEG